MEPIAPAPPQRHPGPHHPGRLEEERAHVAAGNASRRRRAPLGGRALLRAVGEGAAAGARGRSAVWCPEKRKQLGSRREARGREEQERLSGGPLESPNGRRLFSAPFAAAGCEPGRHLHRGCGSDAAPGQVLLRLPGSLLCHAPRPHSGVGPALICTRTCLAAPSTLTGHVRHPALRRPGPPLLRKEAAFQARRAPRRRRRVGGTAVSPRLFLPPIRLPRAQIYVGDRWNVGPGKKGIAHAGYVWLPIATPQGHSVSIAWRQAWDLYDPWNTNVH